MKLCCRDALFETSSQPHLEEFSLQNQLAQIKIELQSKIEENEALRNAIDKKDRALQEKILSNDSLRFQLQKVERSEKELQIRLEDLSREEKRKIAESEEKIDDLIVTCESQKREIAALSSQRNLTNPNDHASDSQTLMEKVSNLSAEIETRNSEIKTLKSRSKAVKDALRDAEDRNVKLEQTIKALQSQLEAESNSFREKQSHFESEILSKERQLKIAQETERSLKEQKAIAEASILELQKRQ